MQSAADIMVMKFKSAYDEYKFTERMCDQAEAEWAADPGNDKLERLWDAAYAKYHYSYNYLATVLVEIVSKSIPDFTEKAARKMILKYGERIEQLVAML